MKFVKPHTACINFAAAVQGVNVVSVNSTAVSVSWNAVVISDTPIDHYTVVYSKISKQKIRAQPSPNEETNKFPASVTSGVINFRNAAGSYQFQVYATFRINDRLLDGHRSASFPFTCTFNIHHV